MAKGDTRILQKFEMLLSNKRVSHSIIDSYTTQTHEHSQQHDNLKQAQYIMLKITISAPRQFRRSIVLLATECHGILN